MSEGISFSDSQDRLLAETTWDRNVVVVAGAGTGKTTILVNRILNLLMREPEPLAMTEIVALTFTNKAATEMKQRLRRELIKLRDLTDDPLSMLFRTRYQLSSEKVRDRAGTALAQLEKAQIGTLHSFAAHLLRLHPLESGIDPSFQEDDGERFKELFNSRWDTWLADELGQTGLHHEHWRRVLSGANLEDVRTLALTLAGESWDLKELTRQCTPTVLDSPLRDWLKAVHEKALHLINVRSGAKQLKAEKMLSASANCLAYVLERGLQGISLLSRDDRTLLEKKIDKPTAGWDEQTFAEAKSIVSISQQLLVINPSYFEDLIGLLLPFLHSVRRSFLTSGWISFDGLLTRATALLRDHPSIRARIKHSYRAILVDEFQDTDPVQYEIVMYLAEKLGSSKASWQELELQPGKLFIVGDPKQSIYAFRRADIEAFERVVEKIIGGGGIAYSLVTNFRSDGGVLSVVNDLFDRLFKAKEHIQPANERLEPQPQRKAEMSAAGVQLRLVTAGDDEEEFDTASATRAEADQLARWLKEELLTGTTIIDRDLKPGALQPGHIALIFRKLTQAQDYLDALRRYGIAYLTDGEKHFYRRQEIIDLVNLLRVLDNPYDRIAVVGLLRSPLGGVSDRDILVLQQLDSLDILKPEALARWPHSHAATLQTLYQRMAELHRLAPHCPVPDVLDLIFERLPVLELAATSLHGEQAVANLWKARDMAEELADRPHLTLTGFVGLMMERLADQPEEAESALAEASLDAVRILTIHKAKGLEFPVVILPGVHQGARAPRKGPTVHYDWSSRCYGVALGTHRNLGSVLVESKMAAREEAEQQRLLYVGMTRARDLLVFSGGHTRKPGRGTVLSLLQEGIGDQMFASETDCLEIGNSRILRVTAPVTMTRRHSPQKVISSAPPPALEPLLERHAARQSRRSQLCMSPRRLTPSLMRANQKAVYPSRSLEKAQGNRAQIVGICVHALLECWDFSRTSAPSRGEIESLCRQLVPVDMDCMTEVHDDITSIIRSLVLSEFYAKMQSATILGREVPFVIPWEEGRMMEGVIDMIYRLEGTVHLADYKTDWVTADTARARAADYQLQAEIYRTAACRCLGLSEVSFEFLFLRPGVAIAM